MAKKEAVAGPKDIVLELYGSALKAGFDKETAKAHVKEVVVNSQTCLEEYLKALEEAD